MKKKALSILAAVGLLLGSASLLPSSSFQKSTSITASAAESNLFENNAIQSRTQQQIINYINSHKFFNDSVGRYLPDTFEVTPSFTNGNFVQGKLSNNSMKYGLNALNVARFIAGLDEVTLDDTFTDYAQAGTLCDAAIGAITHDPYQASGMPDDLYKKGHDYGTKRSNLGMGHDSIADAMISGWLADTGSNNLATVGHRRWCLNPSMGKTGFGHAGSFTAMYAFDKSSGDWYGSGYTVAWPAANMPVELFDSSWNSPVWSLSKPSGFSSSTTVKLTRLSDNKVWNFSTSSSDGEFHINNDGYGQPGCVIFRPTGLSTYCAGDKYKVSITDNSTTISYTVNFFSLPKNTGIIDGTHTHSYDTPKWSWSNTSSAKLTATCTKCETVTSIDAEITKKTTQPTCTTNGNTVYTASAKFNGQTYTNTKTIDITKFGHSYSAKTVPPTAATKGYTLHTCTRCGNNYKDQYTVIDLKITKQPANVVVTSAGKTAEFSISANGTGLKYEWFVKDPGGNWTKTASKTNKYSISVSYERNGRQVFCKVTDINGNFIRTNIVTAKFKAPIAITKQPYDVIVSKAGNTATFSISASGSGLKYEWYIKDVGGNWKKTSATSNKYSVSITKPRNGRQVFCKIIDTKGNSIRSNIVKASIK